MIRVVVAGGGPAGLAAAIGAAEQSRRVTLLERNSQCGIKLLATGGGHANVGNLRPAGEWPALFGKRGRFITPALDFLSRENLCSWLERIGAPVAAPDGFHLFPASNSARLLRDALVAEARRLGVDLALGKRVERLVLEAGAVRGVVAGGETLPGERVIVACGGRSYPATGSSGDGYALAEQAGHRIQSTIPGLVGLRAANLDPELAGLILPDAAVFFKARGRGGKCGSRELLLTHGGVSGPAVLDLSASVAEAVAGGGEALLRLRWCAALGPDAWLEKLAEWRGRRGGAALAALLREYLPLRLVRWLLAFSGVAEDATPATLRNDRRDRLAEALGAFPARITASEGWDKAMITRGGVDLGGVDPKTLASRLASGLYFAGEVLDLDGPCGGYNLHWAFASGMLAGAGAGKG